VFYLLQCESVVVHIAADILDLVHVCQHLQHRVSMFKNWRLQAICKSLARCRHAQPAQLQQLETLW
jgi:hypothetical protein